ncbi:MAG TPA: hypothetical protein VG225_09520 [Terracidiphilus sp.]|jgi:hypothetical protein|nr:hypothetical protein [Terracidiphilus sp.]
MPEPIAESAQTTAVPLFTSAEAAAPPIEEPELEDQDETSSSAPSETPILSLKAAVLNCRKAYHQAFAAEKARGATDCAADTKGAKAYCTAMPFLTSEGNIRAFIACVGHAMAIGILLKLDGLQLVSAARAALSGVPRRPQPVGRPKANFHTP